MNTIDLSETKEAYAQRIDLLIGEYGDYSAVPRDLLFVENEWLRACYCIATQPTWELAETLRYYSIDRRVWSRFNVEEPEGVGRREKRSDKYQSIINWCADNVFAEITPNFLMDVSGMSYPTVLKFIGERPDLFRKIRRGIYEVRDPKADREAEKV